MIAAIGRRIAWLADFPLIAPETDERGVRALPLVQYPYLVYYEIVGMSATCGGSPGRASDNLKARDRFLDLLGHPIDLNRLTTQIVGNRALLRDWGDSPPSRALTWRKEFRTGPSCYAPTISRRSPKTRTNSRAGNLDGLIAPYPEVDGARLCRCRSRSSRATKTGAGDRRSTSRSALP